MQAALEAIGTVLLAIAWAAAVAAAFVVWCVVRGIYLSFYYLVHPHPDYREHLV